MKRSYTLDTPDQQRLKIARAEIEAVLKKHDLAGAVVLHTPGMTEWFYDITPSYSCCWIDEGGRRLRVRSTGEQYGGDLGAQLNDQAATANMMHGLAMDLSAAAEMFVGVAAVATTMLRAQHQPGQHVPDPMEGRRQ
jgi:hypothetical protein